LPALDCKLYKFKYCAHRKGKQKQFPTLWSMVSVV
jgi:hypothetical protein